MQVQVNKKILEDAVLRAHKVTGKNLSLPVLQAVLLIATKDGLRIRATNLDIGIELEVKTPVMKEGVVAVPAGVLVSFLSALPDETTIQLDLVGATLSLATEKTSTVLKTYDADEFPLLPTVSDVKGFSIESGKLVEGFKSVWYAASVSTMKPELASVYVYYEDGNLVFVATDSFRLAEKKIQAKGLENFTPMMIPVKNVLEIIRNLEAAAGTVVCAAGDNQLMVTFIDGFITSRIIDGVFPDYVQIMPKEHTTQVTVLKKDLIDAVKMSTIFSNKFNQVKINIHPKEKVLSIETQNIDVGENTMQIDGTLQGDAFTGSFNNRYISDAFQALHTDSVNLSFSGKGKPVVMRGVSDPSFTYLVMSMNR